MEKITVKNHIIAQQELLINHLESAIHNLAISANLDENEPIGIDDLSHQDEDSDLKIRMQQQLDAANFDLQHLENISIEECTVVKEGALVLTNKAALYIGISAMHSTINGKEIIGISTKSPIFYIIRGKKAGDAFEMGHKNYIIEGIL